MVGSQDEGDEEGDEERDDGRGGERGICSVGCSKWGKINESVVIVQLSYRKKEMALSRL